MSGNGTYNPSAGFTPTAAGNYWWYVSYNGDANNNAATSTCPSATETVVATASPGVTVSAPGTGTAGTAIAASSISSVLNSSSGSSATGTITFYEGGPSASAPASCTGAGWNSVGTAPVSGNGTYNSSGGFTPTVVGNYWWYVSYSGDANNNPANSTCPSVTETIVAKASPSVTVSAPGTGAIGTAISASSISSAFAGSSGSNSSGTITFYEDGPSATAPASCTGAGWNSVGTATVSGNGTYNSSGSFTPTAAGNYWWYASYGGDGNNNAANSPCPATSETVVAKNSPSVTVSAPGSGAAGSAITASSISSSLSNGASPTGTVTFYEDGPSASAPASCTGAGWNTVGTATVSGNGTYNSSGGLTPTVAGNYWWYASYNGDSNNNAEHSTCPSATETIVAKASPTVTAAAPGTGTAGTAIAASSISSVLAGSSGSNATGTITFYEDGPSASAPASCTGAGWNSVGTATVTNNGTYNPSAGLTPTVAGNYWWYVSYNGDANNNAAASTCPSATETIVALASPTVTAAAPSTGTAGTAIATSAISSAFGSSSGSNATGTITFYEDGPSASAPSACTGAGWNSVGTATVTNNGTYHPSAGFTPTVVGNYWWYVSYSGDSNNNPANSTCPSATETVVGKASLTVTAAAPGTGTAGTAIAASSISGTLSGGSGPTGTITFYEDGPSATAPASCTGGGWNSVGTAPVSGNGTYTSSGGITPSVAGNYWWYTSYNGDSNNNAANSTCPSATETIVAKASPTVSAAAPGTGTAGTAISATSITSTFGSSSGSNAIGTITFYEDGPLATAPSSCTGAGWNTEGTAAVSGNGTYNSSGGFTPAAAGNYWWYASYGGDTNNNTEHSNCPSATETIVAKASPTVTSAAPGSGTAGTAIAASSISSTFGSSSGSNATGTITFYEDGPLASAPASCTGAGGTRRGRRPSRATAPTTRAPPSPQTRPVATGGTPLTAATPTTTRRTARVRLPPRRSWQWHRRPSPLRRLEPALPARSSPRPPSAQCSPALRGPTPPARSPSTRTALRRALLGLARARAGTRWVRHPCRATALTTRVPASPRPCSVTTGGTSAMAATPTTTPRTAPVRPRPKPWWRRPR